ncbi:metallophosphoesterase [Devosia submarina]|jgi:calcineurin-like phosphoesterase family protein|uniref:metallophosphoesterase n=1 Tax=Devosia submarina TaxID=1173082 RepID=UPI000D3395A9|nr:metallophosphoesterase [Devosia submarina]
MLIPKFTFASAASVFFTGDTHFGHGSQAKRRGYDDLDEHDNLLIHNWNREVPANGVVFHVGDFAWKTVPQERLEKIFRRLNGKKYLVLGNHDNKAVADLPWAGVDHRMIVQVGSGEDQHEFLLDHYGGRVWYNSHNGVRQLYGHSHNELPSTTAACDVGVDGWMLQPITIADVLAVQREAKITMREVQDLVPGGPRNG